MAGQPHLLFCDAPNLSLEENLPCFRDLGYSCTYLPDITEVTDGELDPDLVVVSAEIRGGAQGKALARIRRLFPDSPIVVVAHVRSLSAAIEFFRAGAVDYLPTPLDPEETRERIAAALEAGVAVRGLADVVEVPVEIANVADTETAAPEPAENAAGNLAAGDPDSHAGVSLDGLPCGVLVFDGNGQVRQCNRAALSLLGQESAGDLQTFLRDQPEEFQLLDLQGKELAAANWPPRRALKDKTYRAATVSLRRPDRTRVWLRVEAQPELEAGRVRRLTVTFSNITVECSEVRRLRQRFKERRAR